MASTISPGRCPHCGATLRGLPRACDQCGREIQPLGRAPSPERTTLSGMRLPPLPAPDSEPERHVAANGGRAMRLAMALVALLAFVVLVFAWWR